MESSDDCGECHRQRDDQSELIMCDNCKGYFHLCCTIPPLDHLPTVCYEVEYAKAILLLTERKKCSDL